MEKVKLTINGIEVEVPSNYTVLEAAKEVGIDIPTLCYLKGINEVGACRVCLVEVEGARSLQASCVLPVRDGMVVKTNTKKVRNAVKTTVELILANHNRECLTCFRNGSCELQKLAEELGIDEISFEGAKREATIDEFSHSIVRDSSKCILCGRCVSVCKNVQGIGILDFTNRGFKTEVAPAFGKSMADAPCIYCGQCINACPVAALREKSEMEKVWDALENPELHVVVQTAPAVRAALGEEFGLPIGTRVTGKMVAALRRLGFDKVFDTNFAADLTIMEEGHELLDRIQNGGKLPMITSCSPGWIRFCEFYYPELIDNLSTCKSPHQMMGAVLKSYYAQLNNLDPEKIFVVSIMPCSSKKTEKEREELRVNGLKDVDAVLTTRELAKMIKQARIKFLELPDEDFDELFGEYTGAGVIFGATGGVMEAALRTVADVLAGEDLKEIEYTAVRGIEGIKEAKVNIADKTIKVAVVHGTANAAKLLDKVRAGETDYHFIEVMGCSGGCVNGGGQPHVDAKTRMEIDVRVERAKALYEEDELRTYRKSHQNPMIKKIYDEFLGKPNSHKAHELLHTHYHAREIYPTQSNCCCSSSEEVACSCCE
ncbi:NAD(P)-dependent iron-only hydrogenase catalytic subunit [Caminicella sporogenes DSM 14501]|uniref:NAD(P)-dependent iron-only hydrogenase catalytic subunit n=1 Tax=Caminicella sporogenes DSM 14501 TaxID=1121266 RepID=A0A1M6QMB3_9FIRM|nr:NADH-dependent [FeFe] hydrogenase, group A6 [Caminicella sporogenes]RKD25262.1 ferredoxin [Caminicella sporogenes]SHK21356.1 NAD(P)-dependent iron-only hydrogenase catalytic subunit [Caminicella sporogenes DSM 14501]